MKRRGFLGLSTSAVTGAFYSGSSIKGNPADEGKMKKEHPNKTDNEYKGLYRRTANYQRRLRQTDKWFSRARLGMFYHWGLYTGGGILLKNPKYNWPLRYPNPEDLERDAPNPDEVARNMVDNAVYCGAKYITLTMFHSCEKLCILYPTNVSGFLVKTSLDYIGAFIRECTRRSIRPILYHNGAPWCWDTPGGPYLAEGYRDPAGYLDLMAEMYDELRELHGDAIAGFWMDGLWPETEKLPALAHRKFPKAMVIVNGPHGRTFPGGEIDYITTEIEFGGHFTELTPAYNRPSAFPGIPSDFNEDIPTCNAWWYYDGPGSCTPERWEFIKKKKAPYLADPLFLVRQMLTSLGHNRRWNFSLGIGPMVNGKMPDEFKPMLETLHAFMEWGSEVVYDTIGGQYSCIRPGLMYMLKGGFCSVTVSMDNPAIHYLIITTAPEPVRASVIPGKPENPEEQLEVSANKNEVKVSTNGYSVAKIEDLRSGANIPFTQDGFLKFYAPDWKDIGEFGAKIFGSTAKKLVVLSCCECLFYF